MTVTEVPKQIAAPARPARLVVVSNRLPFEVATAGGALTYHRSPGGLVTALEAVLAERGGVWIGWPGIEQEPGEAPVPMPDGGAVEYRSVPLTGREVAQYYASFANRTLWPLLHYFVGNTRIDAAAWRVYERVNERFAAAAASASGPDSTVWVHDYQLMRVPALLRRRSGRLRIAFFLHVPFPAADVFRILPWSRSLMLGLLGADLVGFHIREYAEHFLMCAERLLGCETDASAGRVLFQGRTVSVEAHPISIDAALQETLARKAKPARPKGLRQILGVDRLDYTKGIHQRLLAVDRLFERHPEYRRQVVFTQILVPSRERVAEYQQLKRELDEVVGRVNGRFSEPGWSPIEYLVRSLPQEELAGLYRAADVALVTPLRDGMNLVAKEYVASQVDEPGVLVLSEMAGAAAELPEAIVVNPYDVDAVADALHRALEMPPDERRTRMAALRHRVKAGDVASWARRFLEAAEAAALRRAGATSPVETARRRLTGWLVERPMRALFLDYDGTLAPIAERPEEARLGDEARRVLTEAVRAPDLDVVIVSGRSLADVRCLVGVEGLTYVGDHGYEIEGPGISYQHAAADRFQAALDLAAKDLESLRIEGALVERKRATVAYHVRRVAQGTQESAARDAEMIFRRRRLAVMAGNCVVEGRPPVPWDKGQAVLYLLQARHGADWTSRLRALYLGDDVTDEAAFRALRGIGRSIRVTPPGGTPTAADLTLPGTDDVTQLVRWLASGALRART